jgi:hypothetical protein
MFGPAFIGHAMDTDAAEVNSIEANSVVSQRPRPDGQSLLARPAAGIHRRDRKWRTVWLLIASRGLPKYPVFSP